MKQDLEPSKKPALLHLLNGAREANEIAKSFDSQLHYIIIAATDNGNSLDSINGERPILVKMLVNVIVRNSTFLKLITQANRKIMRAMMDTAAENNKSDFDHADE